MPCPSPWRKFGICYPKFWRNAPSKDDVCDHGARRIKFSSNAYIRLPRSQKAEAAGKGIRRYQLAPRAGQSQNDGECTLPASRFNFQPLLFQTDCRSWGWNLELVDFVSGKKMTISTAWWEPIYLSLTPLPGPPHSPRGSSLSPILLTIKRNNPLWNL